MDEPNERRYDAVIVGAGIVGLSIGWRTAQLGLSVMVVEREPRPSGASWVAAGMLAPITEIEFGSDALLQLNIEGARRWPGFLAELSECSGLDLNSTKPGTLYLALDRDQSEALRRLYEHQMEAGLKVAWLDSRSCRSLEPGLHPSVRAGVLAAEDGAVDPRQVSRGLLAALDAIGVRVTFGAEVVSIRTADRPTVKLRDGETISADHVVLAAGCWAGTIEGVPSSIAKALRPVKGQILRLRFDPSYPVLQHVVRTDEVYLVPRPNGELVVGATVEEKGFDLTLTTGGIFELLRAADEVFPGIRELELAEAGVGLRPGTPDNLPLMGPTDVPGLIVAAGHYRNGILQAPLTADTIAHLLAKDELPPEMAALQAGRFGE